MRITTLTLLALAACAHTPPPIDKTAQLDAARALFEQNIRAIQERNREAYLDCYLPTDALVRAGDDGVKLGFAELAEGAAATGSDEWPESLEASDMQVHWIEDGVVYGAYRYVVVIDGKRSEGWSERVFVRRDGRWRIAVTTAFGLAPSEPEGESAPPGGDG
jgi:hypothetical protein